MGAITTVPITIKPDVLVSQESVDRIDDLVDRAVAIVAIPTGDEAAFHAADQLHADLHALSLDIEKARVRIKEPALEFGRRLDQTAKDARLPLDSQRERLGILVKAWQKAENASREAAARAAREEAERKQREAEEAAERQRQAEIDRARQEAEDATPPGEEPPPPPKVETFTAPAVARVATAYVPPPVKSSVREKTDHVVVVVDKALVPTEVAGAEIRPIDLAACKRLMKSGVKIPGLRLDEVSGTAATGR